MKERSKGHNICTTKVIQVIKSSHSMLRTVVRKIDLPAVWSTARSEKVFDFPVPGQGEHERAFVFRTSSHKKHPIIPGGAKMTWREL